MSKRPLHDFSNLDNPTFAYQVPGVDGAAPIKVEVDIDEVALTFQMGVPMLWKATGLVDGKDTAGKPIELNGYGAIVKALHDGTAPPAGLPDWKTLMMVHARVALKVPQHCGLGIVTAVFFAWLYDMQERQALKKNVAPSPGSPAPTPDLSAPKT